MKLGDTYTTNEKIAKEEKDPKIENKIEKTKTVLSNDAYAVSAILEQFSMNIQSLIRSLAK